MPDAIAQPVFVTGEYDEAIPDRMYEYQKLCKNASVEIIEDAAHMTMIDQPGKVEKVIGRFLKKFENK